LIELAGGRLIHCEPTKIEHNEIKESTKGSEYAENHHTVFRQALVIFKCDQRYKILMDRVKGKQNGRS
jgi:hypothetical protein